MTLTPEQLYQQRLAAWQAQQARNFRRHNYHRPLNVRYIVGRRRWQS